MSYINTILDELGIEYKEFKGGEELRFRCVHPKHKDKSPSAFINSQTGLWRCYSCQENGNINHILSYVTGHDKKLEDFFSKAQLFQFKIASIYKKSIDNMLMYEAKILFDETMEYEQSFFTPVEHNKDALDYLTNKRGFTLKTIREHKLMFADDGIYKDRIIIPYYKNGKLIGFNSRYIYDINKKWRYLYYTNPFEIKGYIYNLENITNHKYCILCEGPLDLIWLQQCGFKNVISTLNTNVSTTHLETIMLFGKICFIFDNDKETQAGKKAVLKASKLILSINNRKTILNATLPIDKDPNDCSIEELKSVFNKITTIQLKSS